MPPDRPHDVSGMTSPELQRARRDLQVSLSLAVPGSALREPILAHMDAIDVELERRQNRHLDTGDTGMSETIVSIGPAVDLPYLGSRQPCERRLKVHFTSGPTYISPGQREFLIIDLSMLVIAAVVCAAAA